MQIRFHQKSLDLLKGLEMNGFSKKRDNVNIPKRTYSARSIPSNISSTNVATTPSNTIFEMDDTLKADSSSNEYHSPTNTLPSYHTEADLDNSSIASSNRTQHTEDNYNKDVSDAQNSLGQSAVDLTTPSSPPIPRHTKPKLSTTQSTPVKPASLQSEEDIQLSFKQPELSASSAELDEKLKSQCNVSPSPSNISDAPPSKLNRSYSSPLASISSRKVVRMKYSFEPETENELKLKKGDLLLVLKEIDEGWWVGEKLGEDGVFTGNTGMFPSNYCVPAHPWDKTFRAFLKKGFK